MIFIQLFSCENCFPKLAGEGQKWQKNNHFESGCRWFQLFCFLVRIIPVLSHFLSLHTFIHLIQWQKLESSFTIIKCRFITIPIDVYLEIFFFMLNLFYEFFINFRWKVYKNHTTQEVILQRRQSVVTVDGAVVNQKCHIVLIFQVIIHSLF